MNVKLIALLLVSIVAGVGIYALLPSEPILPLIDKLIITSEDLASSSALEAYVYQHADVELRTMAQVLSESVGVLEPEAPLMVTSIQDVSVSTAHSSWEQLYLCVSPTLDADAWTPMGYWSAGVWTVTASFFGSRYVRLMGSGMKGIVGNVVITYNSGSQLTVNLDKECLSYNWGRWYVTVTGKIQYRSQDAWKLYNFIWSKNPKYVMFFGTVAKVPMFWTGWIYNNMVMQSVTDHPYSVRNVQTDNGMLYRSIPIGRIPVASPTQVDTVISKITSRTSASVGRSALIRDTAVGYDYEVSKMVDALASIGSVANKVEDGTLDAALSVINSGNDIVILGGHGTSTSIACTIPMFTLGSIDLTTFSTYTVGVSYACSIADISSAESIAGKWITTPMSKGIGFIGYNTFTDVASLAFVTDQFIRNYRVVGFGKAIMDGLNLLENLWAIWRNDSTLKNPNHVLQRLCIQFFGCPW